ncbi:MAG: hypothetical protein AAF390_08925 [Pseudomonadota bacterium]
MRSTVFALILAASPAAATPLFPNSVASNDLDFIRPGDPQTFACLRATGTGRREMPDPRRDDLFADGVHLFEALFTDGTMVPIWVHPDVDDPAARAAQLGPPLGHLPTAMRAPLTRVVVLDGDAGAFSEDQGRFFVLGTDRMDVRLSEDDLEETVFHETVHASLDIPHAASAAWRAAVNADGAFVTEYATNPQEDMAEHALFALPVLRHPGRLPPEIETRVRDLIPNRLAFFQALLDDGPWTRPVGPAPTCPG